MVITAQILLSMTMLLGLLGLIAEQESDKLRKIMGNIATFSLISLVALFFV